MEVMKTRFLEFCFVHVFSFTLWHRLPLNLNLKRLLTSASSAQGLQARATLHLKPSSLKLIRLQRQLTYIIAS